MTLAQWPASLPERPTLSDYLEETKSNTIVSKMDAGIPKRRSRFTAKTTSFTVSFVLTSDQVDCLDEFFENQTKCGSVGFAWSHPRTGLPVTAYFASPPKYSARQGLFRASFQVEVQS